MQSLNVRNLIYKVSHFNKAFFSLNYWFILDFILP